MSMANQSDCVCTCEVLLGSGMFRNAICFGGGGGGVLPISITKERPKELTDRVSLTQSLAHVD